MKWGKISKNTSRTKRCCFFGRLTQNLEILYHADCSVSRKSREKRDERISVFFVISA